MKGKQPVEQFFNCGLVSHYSAKACFKRHLNLISYNSENKKGIRIPKAGVCYPNYFLSLKQLSLTSDIFVLILFVLFHFHGFALLYNSKLKNYH